MTAPADFTSALARLAELRAQAVDLERARVEAELALLRQVRAELDAGCIGQPEVDDVFAAAQGNVSKGFHVRWKAELGIPYAGTGTRIAHQRRQQLRYSPNGPGGRCWEGVAPIGLADPVPPPGVSVVYVLYNDANKPIYTGSTMYFQVRLATHRREGKPVAWWMAYPCDDRQQAYELEDRLLRESCPSMNKRAYR